MTQDLSPTPPSDLGAAFFLAGESYPKDLRIEDNLRQRLAPSFAGWRGQAEILALEPSQPITNIQARLATLEVAIARWSPSRPVVLFGRSSGARVATLYATARPVQAVICLGYPFQAPRAQREACRLAHLTQLRTPTLIVQGRFDEYNGPEGPTAFPLSNAVSLRLVDARHDFAIPASAWDALCAEIAGFCMEAARGRRFSGRS